VLFPAVLLAVSLGLGLAVERIGGWRLPGGLLLPVGLALLIVVASLTTDTATTAPWTTTLTVILAAVGYAASWRRLRTLRLDRAALAVGVGVFAICAAPVVASGNATFLGYFVDGDTAAHFGLVDQLLAHGRDVAGLPFPSLSSYSIMLTGLFGSSYPIGADAALGAVRPLVGQDVAWVFQPYLALIVAMGAVALDELLRGVVNSRGLRAVCAFIAGQAGLLYAFYLASGIKEVTAALLITVAVVLVFATPARLRLRSLFPLLIVAVAGFEVFQVAIIAWLGPALAVFAAMTAWRYRHAARRLLTRRAQTRRASAPRAAASRGHIRAAAGAAVAVLALAAFAAPVVKGASTFFASATASVTNNDYLGNLAMPLTKWEMLGIWPTGDFRWPLITHYRVAFALIGIAAASGVLGVVWAVRRRAFGPLLLLACSGAAALYVFRIGSPYAVSKVMMICSVVALLFAMLGSAALHDAGRRVEAWVLASVLAFGVLWTNALAYHDASLAPRGRFAELAAIGTRFSGRGPAFYNLWDPFAVHFLRAVAPAIPTTWGPPSPPERPGLPPRSADQTHLPWDPNDLAQPYLQSFHLLVLGRSPRVSRPPANYRLAYRGRYYDVWQRVRTPSVLQHISLGGGLFPASVPSCRLIAKTAAQAEQEQARIAYVARDPTPTLVPAQATHPPEWIFSPENGAGDPYTLVLTQNAGTVAGTVRVSTPGTYQVWLEGSLSRPVSVWVGRKLVGRIAYQFGSPGQFLHVGAVTLAAGDQPVMIERPAASLSPGDIYPGYAGIAEQLGPLTLVRGSDPPPVSEVAPRGARALCGKPLEWLEIVR
jgi:hypothetical protein